MLPKNVHHLFALASATAWEFALLFRLPREYYIKSGVVYIRDRIPSCWIRYSPSPLFVLLVLLPALVLLALYTHLRDPTLKKSALSVGLPVLSVVLVSIINPHNALWVLLIITAGVGTILGEEKGEKALLAIEGFLPGLVVLMMILGELGVAC
ncbi:MAG TPA: hypothetical protein ENH81_05470 [Thermococcus sp.]|nr:hypothetical protein [Thermococcus sp.]